MKVGNYMSRRKISTELKTVLEKIPEDKRDIAARLADELYFMQGTLTDLKKQVKEQGTIEDFSQGAQKFKRESAALRGYNNTLKQYSSLFKQLCDLMPKEEIVKIGDKLDNFLDTWDG